MVGYPVLCIVFTTNSNCVPNSSWHHCLIASHNMQHATEAGVNQLHSTFSSSSNREFTTAINLELNY
eukprot:5958805-Ditylum_brightwellii.AAC.1